MSIKRHQGWLVILLLVGMLLPVWMGPYVPLYDYSNHLLEAQIVAHYTDPQFGYANYYEINPGWYLHSNALSTMLLIRLGRLMPDNLGRSTGVEPLPGIISRWFGVAVAAN